MKPNRPKTNENDKHLEVDWERAEREKIFFKLSGSLWTKSLQKIWVATADWNLKVFEFEAQKLCYSVWAFVSSWILLIINPLIIIFHLPYSLLTIIKIVNLYIFLF